MVFFLRLLGRSVLYLLKLSELNEHPPWERVASDRFFKKVTSRFFWEFFVDPTPPTPHTLSCTCMSVFDICGVRATGKRRGKPPVCVIPPVPQSSRSFTTSPTSPVGDERKRLREELFAERERVVCLWAVAVGHIVVIFL